MGIVSVCGENRNTKEEILALELYSIHLPPKFSTDVLIVKGIAAA
jgi:hypothetical protein